MISLYEVAKPTLVALQNTIKVGSFETFAVGRVKVGFTNFLKLGKRCDAKVKNI